MRKIQYKISIPGNEDYILATYEEGELHALEGIHKLGRFWEDVCINAPVPLLEKQIPAKLKQYAGVISIEVLAGSGTGEKIAMFCAAYKKHLSINYRRGYGDPKLMAEVPVTPELLDLYFTNTEWWGKQPKSIRNLAKNFNALLQLQAKPTQKTKTTNFPDEWDYQYESRLKGTQIKNYWAHLRSLGLRPQKDAMGNTLKWVKEVTILILLAVILSSCMTPKRVQRYLADNPQLLPPAQVDTLIDTITVVELDTVTLLPDSLSSSWSWTWGDATDKDSTFQVDAESSNRPASTTVTAKDTLHDGKPRTIFMVKTVVERDTIILMDTVQIEKQVINTRTVIVKPRSWTSYIPWILGALVLIALLVWRRRK